MTESAPYTLSSNPIEVRVEDLLKRMTLEEKIGQMYQKNGREDDVESAVRDLFCGSILQSRTKDRERLQKIASEETRLGIPLIFGVDAIHGHNQWKGATVFPTQLTLASSWNPTLGKQMAEITAREMALTGIRWTFSPVAGIARDLRWGRVGETCGEDPYLVSRFVEAIVKGYQGKSISDPKRVVACVKHFAGYSETQGGRDSSEADISRRKLMSYFLPSFEAAIRAGCKTVMIGYQAIDGEPCTTNSWLLRDILRKDWGFDGFTVTDWNNVGSLVDKQFVCETVREAAVRSVRAGTDMIMVTEQFVESAIAAVKEGDLEESLIDDAVRAILRVKFEMGLFDENRYPDASGAAEIIGCEAHREASLNAARQSLVLLKNDGDLLPLPSSTKRVALFGQNADDELAQLGDWSTIHHNTEKYETSGHPRENTVTLFDALRARDGLEIQYVRACGPYDDPSDDSEFETARIAAEKADVAVVCLGDKRKIVGEAHDRANLDLPGNQQALLEAIHATGTPVVLVLINSKPHTIPWAAEHIPAIIEAFNPGMRGGTAITEALFGDINPSGKLPVSFPRAIGQQPVYYNQIPGWHTSTGGYVDLENGPLFAFGYGLSYTTFEYSNLTLLSETLTEKDTVRASIDITNTGSRSGTEIVQAYVNDKVSSLTTPVKELKWFDRVELAPGERRTVSVEIPVRDLSLVNHDLERIVEPGEFELMVGGSSRDEDLQKITFRVVSE